MVTVLKTKCWTRKNSGIIFSGPWVTHAPISLKALGMMGLFSDSSHTLFCVSDGRVLLPGGRVSLSYFGRHCVIAVDWVRGVDGETQTSVSDLSSHLERLSIQHSTPNRSQDASPLTPRPPSTPCNPSDLVLSPSDPSFCDSPLRLSPPAGRSSTDTFYAVCSSTTLSISDPAEQDEGDERSKVTYSMIGGLSGQLQVIRETIELPLKHPELFKNYGEGGQPLTFKLECFVLM